MEEEVADAASAIRPSISIEVPSFQGDRDDYTFYEPDNSSIQRIIAERDQAGEQQYKVLTWDGDTQWLRWDIVIGMDFGNEALTAFEQRPRYGGDGAGNTDDEYSDDEDEDMADPSEDDDESEEEVPQSRRRTRASTAASSVSGRGRRSRSKPQKSSTRQALQRLAAQKKTQSKSRTRDRPAARPMRSTRTSAQNAGKLISQTVAYQQAILNSESDGSESSDNSGLSDDIIISDLQDTPSHWKKRGRKAKVIDISDEEPSRRTSKRVSRKRARSEDESEDEEYLGRRSGRTAHTRGSMKERDEEDIETVEVKTSAPRVIYQREVFREFNTKEEFAQVHTPWCDTCSDPAGRMKGPLVLCQGCSSAYHKGCIGNRAVREHLVTKLCDQTFVLQCKRCTRRAHKAEKRLPRLDVCTDCRKIGRSCEPFRKFPTKKATREETPEVDVPGFQINNPANVLFRCCKCHRGYHFHHLPNRGAQNTSKAGLEDAQSRLNQYDSDWMCIECVEFGENKISDIIAWRPSDETLKESKDTFDSGIQDFDYDEVEYLIRFAGDDYTKAKWCTGAWIHSVSSAVMRLAFEKRDPSPQWTSADAIPESYFRVDIVFDVKYTSIVPNMTENVEKQRIREIVEVYVKFKGLGYEDAMWVTPPSEEEEERYADFKRAYFEFCKGNHIRLPRGVTKTIEALRRKDFNSLEVKTQPKYISGGTLKDYQIDGMNWLYYRWFKGNNAILADEMGLGKTIQIISFLEVLRQEHKVWPFLVVAPHSTVPNWVREIRAWAPGMRVVTFFGSAEAIRLAKRYELFSSAPSASNRDLKCHIVVTSYNAIGNLGALKAVPWQVLIVDEGQRLKSDETKAYKELLTFKFHHKVLLTGTPLQNNLRELFNLLQFLDPKGIDAEELEEEFATITEENLEKLHEKIRPYFLRRTKTQALKDLPPISDVIIPLTATKLQRELLTSILRKDAEVLKAILSKSSARPAKSNLNNIIMQLRKVLCHPFVYAEDVEEKLEDQELMLRNLIDASCKLKFLELMLPRLHEQGHRVLMFTQFLGMLDIMEDFLNGLGLKTLRLDGTIDTIGKQKLIDAYNAPGSPYFAFVISTRAGGVGINLATADTVIILDPDFNPHQDIQAIARAHRIGQKKKVLVFHLITASSSEEKILKIARKKLEMDHLIIQRMGAEGQEEEPDEGDLGSALTFGAADMIQGNIKNIVYDMESIDKLLDRDHMKDTLGEQGEASERDNQFAFARVWATESGERKVVGDESEEKEPTPDPDLWTNIIQQRLDDAAREKAAREAEYGRGRRRTAAANYVGDGLDLGDISVDEEDTPVKKPRRKANRDDDDTDFNETEDSGSDTNSETEAPIPFHPGELKEPSDRRKSLDVENRVGSPSGNAGPMPEYGNGLGAGMITAGSPYPGVPYMPPHMAAPHGSSTYPPQPPFYHPEDNMNPMVPYPQQMSPQAAYGPAPYHSQGMDRQMQNGLGIMNPQNAADIRPGASARITPILSNHPQPPYGTFAPPHPQTFANYQGQPLPPPPPHGIPVECRLCTNTHMPGECPLRNIPVEYCQLCGTAHFGEGPACPHLGSVTQIGLMMAAVKESNDSPQYQALVKNYLRNRKGAIIQQRKQKKAKAERLAAENEAVKELARKGT
ncbi:hypothetical protein TWF730_002790 [Orbilia blumenaviensis]|uniref:Uncharacterized protein n=1 Tax=Orbilia blumenaviensis TaxID=1796055 RepID=A0AAV9U7Y2_9PEZI